MDITILTQYYPPEIGAPQRRLSFLAERLVKRGHRVTVLTAMPNYPQGKIYPGYGGFLRVEQRDGVRVIRTLIYPSQSPKFLPRLLSYFSFVFSAAAIGGLRLGRCGYLLTESPPLFLGLTGFLLSHWKKARWIFNVSDIWPESAVRLGVLRPGPALEMSQKLEAFCYKKAWLVTGQSESILASIRVRFPDVPTRLFSNGVDTDQFCPERANPESRGMLHQQGQCAVLYAGLHGLAQGLEQVLEAANLLKHQPDLQFFMMGDGPTKRRLIAEAKRLALANLKFLDPVAPEEMPSWIAAADIAIIPLKSYIPGAVPSKLYEAMAAGVPVLLVAQGEPADLVTRHQAGMVVCPGDIQGIADALQSLCADPGYRRKLGRNGQRAVQERFSRDHIIKDLAEYLEQNV